MVRVLGVVLVPEEPEAHAEDQWTVSLDEGPERLPIGLTHEPGEEVSIQTTYWGSRPELVEVLDLGARGLLQLMPTTGANLAPRAGVEGFSADALFTPETNLRLGAVYLDDLVHRFGGRLSAAIASYNAGPEAVSRWLEAGRALADDEWVEDISYEQTRGYVKRVLRSLHVYRSLYPL